MKPRSKSTEEVPVEFEAPDGPTRSTSPDGPARKRRRPSGEPPPLPRPLRTSGKLMLAYMGLILILLLIVGPAGLDVRLIDGTLRCCGGSPRSGLLLSRPLCKALPLCWAQRGCLRSSGGVRCSL